jgi:8-oxo-dGTP pyrophosphatase MutT (NUDIX family)
LNKDGDPQPDPLAATIVLMRDTRDGPPELLMLERAASMAFAAGALVFPGGRVEEQDWVLAGQVSDQLDLPPEDIAQRIAAIRETIEEVGIAVGLTPQPDEPTLKMIRDGLAAGDPFDGLLQQAGLALALDALVPFAWWRPSEKVARRFDTRFFLATAPQDASADADGNESVRALWATARSLLDDAEAGLHRVIYPTWCNLDRLAQFASIKEAEADGARHAHFLASGRIERRDGVDWLCVDEGIGYPTTARLLDDSLRS